ncbi:MAG: ribonuclease H-like YkuK family protein [Desulfitobacterium sp.]
MYSLTYGEVSFEEMYQLIRAYTAPNENVTYELAVGADSQNFSYTKVPITIGVHKYVNNVGRGGIFFAEIKKVKKITNTRQKIIYETNLSLEYAKRLQDRFMEDGIDCKVAIHVDAGFNGPSAQFVDEVSGWVKACGFPCRVKPESYMASSVANRLSK